METFAVILLSLFLTQHPLRSQHQHQRHQHEDQHEAGFRQQQNAHRLHHTHQHSGQIGPGDAAHAAHHHDDKGVRHHAQINAEIGGILRQTQRAAQPGQTGPQGEDSGEQKAFIHAEG